MKKYLMRGIQIVFVLAISSMLVLVLFKAEFRLFSDKKLKIVSFDSHSASYCIKSFEGNATVSNTLIISKVYSDHEKIITVMETFNCYIKKRDFYSVNDTLYFLSLETKGGSIDTFNIITKHEPESVKILLMGHYN